MLQIAASILQIINFLAQNKDQIRQLIITIQNLIPDAPGSEKSLQVRHFIAASLNLEEHIEQIWPLVTPLFNALVANVKKVPEHQ